MRPPSLGARENSPIPVELDTQDKAEIAQKLVDLLGRENGLRMAGRSCPELRRSSVTRSIEVGKHTLPEAWNQLVSEPDLL